MPVIVALRIYKATDDKREAQLISEDKEHELGDSGDALSEQSPTGEADLVKRVAELEEIKKRAMRELDLLDDVSSVVTAASKLITVLYEHSYNLYVEAISQIMRDIYANALDIPHFLRESSAFSEPMTQDVGLDLLHVQEVGLDLLRASRQATNEILDIIGSRFCQEEEQLRAELEEYKEKEEQRLKAHQQANKDYRDRNPDKVRQQTKERVQKYRAKKKKEAKNTKPTS